MRWGGGCEIGGWEERGLGMGLGLGLGLGLGVVGSGSGSGGESDDFFYVAVLE